MGRRRAKEPKRNAYCLKLTDKQQELLKEYVELKGYLSEVDALRHIVDGLEDWLARQRARIAGRQQLTDVAPPEHQSDTSVAPPREVHSGLDSADDVELPDVDTSVGDFAGRPSIALPEPRFDED